MEHRAEAFLRDLAGRWRVRRLVVDHQGRQCFIFVGEALITPSRFEEHGAIQVNGTQMSATRAYLLGGEGSTLTVLRESGAPFFSLDLAVPAIVHHLCGEDRYSGRFFRRDEACWAEHWRVVGPRKRYSSLTVFRRPPR